MAYFNPIKNRSAGAQRSLNQPEASPADQVNWFDQVGRIAKAKHILAGSLAKDNDYAAPRAAALRFE